jgi:probable addiction module antidote protein
MSIETTRWDGSEYMDSPESMIFRIDDAVGEGDPVLMALVLGHVAKSIGMSLISRETGLDRAILYKALVSDGRRETAALTEALRIVKDRLAADPSLFNEAAE